MTIYLEHFLQLLLPNAPSDDAIARSAMRLEELRRELKETSSEINSKQLAEELEAAWSSHQFLTGLHRWKKVIRASGLNTMACFFGSETDLRARINESLSALQKLTEELREIDSSGADQLDRRRRADFLKQQIAKHKAKIEIYNETTEAKRISSILFK